MFRGFEDMLADPALKLSMMIERRQSEIEVMKQMPISPDYLDQFGRVISLTKEVVFKLYEEHRN